MNNSDNEDLEKQCLFKLDLIKAPTCLISKGCRSHRWS